MNGKNGENTGMTTDESLKKTELVSSSEFRVVFCFSDGFKGWSSIEIPGGWLQVRVKDGLVQGDGGSDKNVTFQFGVRESNLDTSQTEKRDWSVRSGFEGFSGGSRGPRGFRGSGFWRVGIFGLFIRPFRVWTTVTPRPPQTEKRASTVRTLTPRLQKPSMRQDLGGPRGRRGFTRQPKNSKRAHLMAPGASNTTKIPREDTQ